MRQAINRLGWLLASCRFTGVLVFYWLMLSGWHLRRCELA